MDAFNAGPFTYTPRGRSWSLHYGHEFLAESLLADGLSRSQVREAFAERVATFVRKERDAHEPDVLQLLEVETDRILASIRVRCFPEGMKGVLPSDSAPLWLVTRARPLRSRPITLSQFATLGALMPPALGWVAELLPAAVLSTDAQEWRAPNAWELRHVVGEASFTGVTGDQAAALVGLTPQYLRKCMASDGASSRQEISFAHWHLLLQRLGVMPAVASDPVDHP